MSEATNPVQDPESSGDAPAAPAQPPSAEADRQAGYEEGDDSAAPDLERVDDLGGRDESHQADIDAGYDDSDDTRGA